MNMQDLIHHFCMLGMQRMAAPRALELGTVGLHVLGGRASMLPVFCKWSFGFLSWQLVVEQAVILR